ncbi:MAG: CRISPR-associated protein Cas5 [Clostridiales Family XIII bacterium]|nr:CRISPR-associated protein Cas5 [Clostridiales Family XIII bacterium]
MRGVRFTQVVPPPPTLKGALCPWSRQPARSCHSGD